MSGSQPEEVERRAAMEFLGLIAAQQQHGLPPAAQILPPPDPEVARDPQNAEDREAPDVPQVDPPPPEQKDQSAEQPTPRHRLLSRLLRALPIASVDQLTAMINVFNPNQDAALPRPDQSLNPAVPPAQSYPGRFSSTSLRSGDPLQHLLARPSQKRSDLTK